MFVVLTTSRVGDGFSQEPGETVEVKDDEGKRMIERGLAVPHERAPTPSGRVAVVRSNKHLEVRNVPD